MKELGKYEKNSASSGRIIERTFVFGAVRIAGYNTIEWQWTTMNTWRSHLLFTVAFEFKWNEGKQKKPLFVFEKGTFILLSLHLHLVEFDEQFLIRSKETSYFFQTLVTHASIPARFLP